MRARRMGIIKEDSIMELGRVVFSLFIFVIRWFVSCHGQRIAFAKSAALWLDREFSLFLVNSPKLRQE